MLNSNNFKQVSRKILFNIKEDSCKNDETPFFLISLIEHKSNVDYNVVMQIFRYIAFIWADYEKEM